MSDKNYIRLSLNKLKSLDLRSLWNDVKEAIAGTERDFTNTPLGKSIFILAVPMVLEMIMESIFAVVDIFFVSRLGADAVATVGLTESAMTIVYAIGVGLSMATTALVSRRIGEKKSKEAGVVAFQAIVVGIIISALLAVPGYLFAKEFLEVMGASDEMVSVGYEYPAIMFGTNMVIMLLFIINAVYRSSGDAAISMRVIYVANIINLVLDPLLIFGWGPFPELGIKGAAIATSIGRGIGVVYQIYILFRGKHRIRLYWSSLKIRFDIMFNLLRISGGGILQNIIAMSSWIFLVRVIAVLGAEALAGYTIAIRIIIFALLPAWGLSNAAATLVGQNLGAKKPDRAERAVKITGYFNMGLMGVISIFLISFPSTWIGIFTDAPNVLHDGIVSLRTISYGFVMYGIGMVLVQGFNGSGDTMTPTKINLVSFWLLEIPVAYLLAIQLDMGLVGACIAILAAETLLTILGWYFFRKGKWKEREV